MYGCKYCVFDIDCNGLPDSDLDSDSNSDCEPSDHIILCRTFHTAHSRIQILILKAQYRDVSVNIFKWQ